MIDFRLNELNFCGMSKSESFWRVFFEKNEEFGVERESCIVLKEFGIGKKCESEGYMSVRHPIFC